MSPVAPLPEAEATDKTEQTYGRIKEMLGADVVPEPFLYYGRVPAFLQDFYMNSKKFIFTDGKLEAKKKALSDKLVELSVGELLGDAIRRIHEDRSVSALFKDAELKR